MFDNPFQSSQLDQLQNQYQSQLDALNRMRTSDTSNLLGQIGSELGQLSKEDLSILYESPDYQGAKSIYEAGFLQFISNKFAQEYINTSEGREAASNLLKTIKEGKTRIAYQAKVKSEKIEKILELLETDPDLRKRYSELTTDETNSHKRKLSNGVRKGNSNTGS